MFSKKDKVKVKNTKIYGKIEEISNKKAMLKTTDFKKIIVKVEDLEKYDFKEDIPKVTIRYDRSMSDMESEVMLRHLTKEEAINKLDLFISKAIMNKVYKIKIIHGKNGGILRQAVHEYLRNSKYIEKFELAGYFEGQYGVTIAYIAKK